MHTDLVRSGSHAKRLLFRRAYQITISSIVFRRDDQLDREPRVPKWVVMAVRSDTRNRHLSIYIYIINRSILLYTRRNTGSNPRNLANTDPPDTSLTHPGEPSQTVSKTPRTLSAGLPRKKNKRFRS